GPVVGVLIILLVLTIGAFYFWGAYLNKKGIDDNPPPFIPGDPIPTVSQ
ncbi:MAG: hypothetical protein RIQ56_707, partial [Candidatus Parcubacteria bacterium]